MNSEAIVALILIGLAVASLVVLEMNARRNQRLIKQQRLMDDQAKDVTALD
jgi:hypothetical protein